ncbi:MAG: conjugative transfer signal peptidase TraF [Thiothrix sp.]|nr:conjugative transfer signal peptidase TraF [Thiothrix sp.]
MKRWHWFFSRLSLLAVVAGLLVTVAHQAGIRLNRSESLPGLFWWFHPLEPGQTILPGQTVFICPPDTDVFRQAKQRGYLPFGMACPGDYPALLKPVAGVAGDAVEWLPAGIRINGRLQRQSRPRVADSSGRPLQHPQRLTIPAGQLFLLSDYTPRSWDSRYFGSLPITGLLGTASPLFGHRIPPPRLLALPPTPLEK